MYRIAPPTYTVYAIWCTFVAMEYTKLRESDLAFFRSLLGDEYVMNGEEAIAKYSRDETDGVSFPPDVVLKPADTAQISAIMKYCNENKIPVSPRAAGTGLSANSLCVYGGVMLLTDRLNKILKIDERNLQVTTEPGVITQVLQEADRHGVPDQSLRDEAGRDDLIFARNDWRKTCSAASITSPLPCPTFTRRRNSIAARWGQRSAHRRTSRTMG